MRKPTSREDVACTQCGATWRAQACMLSVLEGLGYPEGASVSPDFSRYGLGISDDMTLAQRLFQLFMYTNSYYHQFPKIDVTSPPAETRGQFEFIVCSDVLEHVPPPAEFALLGLHSMLRPGGFLVVSVPCQTGPQTAEYYPKIVTWELSDDGLRWRDSAGSEHFDPDPELHGGSGQTLAFRFWSVTDLAERLLSCGFSSVRYPSRLPPIDDSRFGVEEAGILIAMG